jgi:hypothetical protein
VVNATLPICEQRFDQSRASLRPFLSWLCVARQWVQVLEAARHYTTPNCEGPFIFYYHGHVLSFESALVAFSEFEVCFGENEQDNMLKPYLSYNALMSAR